MCLFTKRGTPFKTAGRALKRYKVLLIDEAGTTRTPFMSNPVEFGEPVAGDVAGKDTRLYKYDERGMDCYDRGFLHVYKSLKKARDEVSCLDILFPERFPARYILVEAVIPKGARYIDGVNGDTATEKVIYKNVRI